MLLAIIRQDNEQTWRRPSAWAMTVGLVTVYQRIWCVTKEEKQPGVTEPADQVVRPHPHTSRLLPTQRTPCSWGTAQCMHCQGARPEDLTWGILRPGIHTLCKAPGKTWIFPRFATPRHSTVLNKEHALKRVIEMESATSGSLQKFQLVTLKNF